MLADALYGPPVQNRLTGASRLYRSRALGRFSEGSTGILHYLFLNTLDPLSREFSNRGGQAL